MRLYAQKLGEHVVKHALGQKFLCMQDTCKTEIIVSGGFGR